MTARSAAWELRRLELDLDNVVLSVATNAGPRILSYRRPRGAQLFADLGPAAIDHPDAGHYLLLGGHRLWRAPEVPAISYEPDTSGVAVMSLPTGVELEGHPDKDEVVKRMTVHQEGPITIVTHTLINRGKAPVITAPWSITQMAPGGRAVLPIGNGVVDPDGLQANGSLVLWPYTDLGQPGIEFTRQYISINDRRDQSRTKVGYANTRGWIAYATDEEIFVKWAPLHDTTATYPDLGASMQCFRDEQFLELESVGPLVEIAPGEDVSHREAWTVVEVGPRTVEQVLATLPPQPEGIHL